MKRLLAAVLAVVMCMGCVSIAVAEESEGDAWRDLYKAPGYGLFTTPASENGLAGLFLKIEGKVIEEWEMPSGLIGLKVENSSGEIWLIGLTASSHRESLGKDMTVFGSYLGTARNYDELPAVTCIRYEVDGEVINVGEDSVFLYQAFENKTFRERSAEEYKETKPSYNIDLMTEDELRLLQKDVSTALTKKASAKAEVNMIDGVKTLRELFPDIELAKIVRDAIPKVSVDDAVTQEELDSVSSISFSHNQVADLTGISHLRKLTSLRASGFSWAAKKEDNDGGYAGKTLTDEIGSLVNLRSLSFWGVKFTEMPTAMKNLVSLEYLTVSGGVLLSLPEWIGELQSLKSIDVRATYVSELPDSLYTLVNLESLDISNTSVTILDEKIGNLTSLRSLNISNTSISSLPQSIYSLSLTEFEKTGTSIE